MIVIMNNGSGGVAADEKMEAEVAGALRKAGQKATIWRAGSGEELAALTQRAAASAEEDTIVAAGGDGTVNVVAAALVDSPKKLGVLALGTLNHFAKDLGLPLDLGEAAQTLADGHETQVDVGEVNGRVFLNNSSLGLYPRIVRHREIEREQLGLGKWPAFAWALLSALHVCPRLRLRLRFDGGRDETAARTPFLFIGNNVYGVDGLQIGGRERLDAGVLSVYFARGTGRLGLLGLALRSLIGRLKQAKNFEMQSTRELRVETRQPRIDVSTDGEVNRLETPLVYRIRPRALRVIVPLPQRPS